MIKTFDDYDGIYYWTAYDNGTLSLFDTKEKAIEAAEQEIKLNNLGSGVQSQLLEITR
jgi:16S rRNA G1207 methylase RsmC